VQRNKAMSDHNQEIAATVAESNARVVDLEPTVAQHQEQLAESAARVPEL
jgi:UDP-N-acetylglucosamine transferase subunit ALG13